MFEIDTGRFSFRELRISESSVGSSFTEGGESGEGICDAVGAGEERERGGLDLK